MIDGSQFFGGIEQLAMFNFDIAIVTGFLMASLFVKTKQTKITLIVMSFIYLFLLILWHFYDTIVLGLTGPFV